MRVKPYHKTFFRTISSSDVLRNWRNPLWLLDKVCSIFGRMRWSVMSDSALRRVVRSTIGRRLLRGPVGFPGFGSTMSVPRPSSNCSPSSNIWLNMNIIAKMVKCLLARTLLFSSVWYLTRRFASFFSLQTSYLSGLFRFLRNLLYAGAMVVGVDSGARVAASVCY